MVRRAAKQGGDAVEEFLNDTTERLQRHGVLAIATTFAIGVVRGCIDRLDDETRRSRPQDSGGVT